MTWDFFFQLLQLAAPFGTAYLGYMLALRRMPGESRKLDADATGVLSEAFVKLLTATQAERVAAALDREQSAKEREAFENRINVLESEITELKVRITDNGLETQKKIIEVEEKAKAAYRKYRVMKGVMLKLARALQENDPPIAIPDLNGDLIDLGESVKDLPLTAEQREQLKGKK